MPQYWNYQNERGELIGPITAKELKELAIKHRIGKSTLVQAPKGQWVKARDVKGLFDRPLKETRCGFCDEVVSPNAKKCKHCGEFLDQRLWEAEVDRQRMLHQGPDLPKWNPGIAAVLSLVIPGAGQMYKGQVPNGVAWLICTLIGYGAFVVPGFILHIFCIIGAASGDPRK